MHTLSLGILNTRRMPHVLMSQAVILKIVKFFGFLKKGLNLNVYIFKDVSCTSGNISQQKILCV